MLSKIFKRLRELIANCICRSDVYYITENARWAIWQVGKSLLHHIGGSISARMTTQVAGIRGSVVHFGSFNTFISGDTLRMPHRSNKVVVTWYHVVPGDVRVQLVQAMIARVDLWHTACSLTRDKLVDLGVPADKIRVLPIGIESAAFRPASPGERTTLRREFGIPQDAVVVGSFQKDGNGWGEGDEPKLIKGPDLFCDAVEALHRERPLWVFLSGPARGYVKKRLEGAGIPYVHRVTENPIDVAAFYRVIDLYIMASREEGGPQQLAESMASGVPVVATRAGMAPDMIVHGQNGFLVEVADADSIAGMCAELLADSELREAFIRNGLETVKEYGWERLAGRYAAALYRPLLREKPGSVWD